jgi:hypothetical protein
MILGIAEFLVWCLRLERRQNPTEALLWRQVVIVAEMMKRIDAMHGRLTLELLDILCAAGFIQSQAPGSYAGSDLLGSAELLASVADIGAQKNRLETQLVPDLASNVELVWVCMQALPDILTGDLVPQPSVFLHTSD